MKSIPIKINKNNPFENCQLNREQYAEILMNIIDTYPEGFVLAIDVAWGTGKTTFMQMFQ